MLLMKRQPNCKEWFSSPKDQAPNTNLDIGMECILFLTSDTGRILRGSNRKQRRALRHVSKLPSTQTRQTHIVSGQHRAPNFRVIKCARTYCEMGDFVSINRIAEWTIEVMKAARTSIFEPEVRCILLHWATPLCQSCMFRSWELGRQTLNEAVIEQFRGGYCYNLVFLTVFQFLQEDSVGKNAQTSGLSWVRPGTHDPFTREDT